MMEITSFTFICASPLADCRHQNVVFRVRMRRGDATAGAGRSRARRLGAPRFRATTVKAFR
ncbi:hypothetical protein, partial [Longimicrobium sp.]|uniref:hypothetical protein n=1 Tax=Longimicrobium sp. TaxID=2029185 RepID=UPI003B3AB208